jgi:hypothetical protein
MGILGKMGMDYTIGTDEPIFIYGGGIFGVGCANRMIASGYNVVGIIDINPGQVKDSPVPVLTPDAAATKYPGIFIWICLANGVPHTEIAMNLSLRGFERILFLPLFLDSKTAKSMIRAYNAFCIGNCSLEIPSFSKLWSATAEDYIINENSGFVTARIHKNHIYTTDIIFNKMTDNPYSLHKTLNHPYALYQPYEPISKLIDFYKNVFQNYRSELFNFFEATLYTNTDYFIDCPCACTINKNGTWDILDGHHRATFLLIKGFTAIPVRVKREEFIKYFNEEDAKELMEYCKKGGTLPFASEHPAFLRFPVNNRYQVNDKITQLTFNLNLKSNELSEENYYEQK